MARAGWLKDCSPAFAVFDEPFPRGGVQHHALLMIVNLVHETLPAQRDAYLKVSPAMVPLGKELLLRDRPHRTAEKEDLTHALPQGIVAAREHSGEDGHGDESQPKEANEDAGCEGRVLFN